MTLECIFAGVRYWPPSSYLCQVTEPPLLRILRPSAPPTRRPLSASSGRVPVMLAYGLQSIISPAVRFRRSAPVYRRQDASADPLPLASVDLDARHLFHLQSAVRCRRGPQQDMEQVLRRTLLWIAGESQRSGRVEKAAGSGQREARGRAQRYRTCIRHRAGPLHPIFVRPLIAVRPSDVLVVLVSPVDFPGVSTCNRAPRSTNPQELRWRGPTGPADISRPSRHPSARYRRCVGVGEEVDSEIGRRMRRTEISTVPG